MKGFKFSINHDVLSGIGLFCSAVIALIISNSPWQQYYTDILGSQPLLSLHMKKPLILLINEGLMAIFFLMVGLEIKHELLDGSLDSLKKVAAPFMAAIGGMLFPAGIYCLIVYTDASMLRGWAIPTATDIAFSLGVLSLLGRHVLKSLRVFLVTLAIFDDLGAIIIIGLFYTDHLSLYASLLSVLVILVLAALNMMRVKSISIYIIVGMVLWSCVLESGIHATLAGVVVAMAIPLRCDQSSDQPSPLIKLEKILNPWVNYMILPLFAFANSGVSFGGLTIDRIFSPVVFAIFSGLFLGKQFGIISFIWLGERLGIPKPRGANWPQLYGIALLCGIGFTMSLFIGSLAFSAMHDDFMIWVRIGVLFGSLVSGVAGYMVLSRSLHVSNRRGESV